MKLLVAGIYPPDVGGPATYAALLERELPKRGFEVAIAPFATVRNLPPLVRHVAYFLRLLGALGSADILFVQDTVSSGLPAVFAAWMAHKPLVLRIGGDYAWEQGTQRFGVKEGIEDFQEKFYGPRVECLRAVQKFVVRNADVVIAPSHYLGEIVEKWMKKDSQVEVVYNGVELPLVVEELQDRPGGALIVSAGRLVAWKGFDGLIAAVAEREDWTLVIVGDGPEREYLQKLAEETECNDRVIFTGNLPREKMLGWCKAADVFVLNSSYEGLSHLLIEVQSLGTPTIATAIGGNMEVVEDNKNGLLVSPGSHGELTAAIDDLVSDTELAERLGNAGKERMKDFSIDATMNSLVRILNMYAQ